MTYWNNKVKIVVLDNEPGNHTAVKNRFPPSSDETQSLTTILERLRTGRVEYESIVITVNGVRREDVPILFTGGSDVVSER